MLTHTGSKAGKGGGPECLVESGGEAGGEGAVVLSQGGAFVSLNHLCNIFKPHTHPKTKASS